MGLLTSIRESLTGSRARWPADDEQASAGPVADEFEALVDDAIDALPEELRELIGPLPIVISDLGDEHSAYGLYQGDGVTRDDALDQIIIFRDTLLRDFGDDRELLAEQISITLRHEIAHHLGWDERGVGGLGL